METHIELLLSALNNSTSPFSNTRIEKLSLAKPGLSPPSSLPEESLAAINQSNSTASQFHTFQILQETNKQIEQHKRQAQQPIIGEHDGRKTESSQKEEDDYLVNYKEEQCRRDRLSKGVKELIRLFREWIKINCPQNLYYIKWLKQSSNQSEVIEQFVFNVQMRELFLMFQTYYSSNNPQKSIARKAKQWIKYSAEQQEGLSLIEQQQQQDM